MISILKCDLCGSKNKRKFLKKVRTWEHKGEFNLDQCCNCGLIFVNPRPSLKKIQEYYPKEDYWGWEVGLDVKSIRNRDYKPIYNYIFSNIQKGKILDIGTGSGYFLTEFKDRNWRTIGTDISKSAKHLAFNKYSLEVKTGEFTSMKFEKNRFDVVTLNNVLEHLISPRRTLLKVKKILRKGGLLVITVPNIDSVGFNIFGKNWHPLQPPRHLYHFNKKTLSNLLELSGFEVKKIITNYRIHILYSLFESFRFKNSPRFKQGTKGGKMYKDYKWRGFSSLILKKLGIICGYVLAYSVYLLELINGRSEVITLCAKKK